MDDSEYLPNDGEFFLPSEPEERKLKRATARSRTRANEELILEVINRHHERIAFYSSIDSIPADVLADQEMFRITVMAHKQTVANLQLEIDHWKGELKNSHIKF